MLSKSKSINFAEVIFLLFPILVVSGPFLSDASVVIMFFFATYLILSKKIIINYEIRYFFFLIVFFCLCIISSALNYGFDDNFLKSLSFFRFYFFIIVIGFIINNNHKLLNLSFIILLITLLFVILDSYLQFFLGKDLIGNNLLDPKRLSGPFGDEYILGSFLLNFSPVMFYLCKNLKKHKNFLLFFFFIVIEPLILLAGQRAVFFMSLIFIFALFLFFYKDKFFYLNLFVSFLMIFSILTFNKNYQERYIDDVAQNFIKKNEIIINDNKKDINFSVLTPSHTTIYFNAINMFLDKPFIGHGIKSFRKICKNYNPDGCSNHAHNYYLEILAEIGILGFIIISLFYLNLIRHFFINLKKIFLKKQLDKDYFVIVTILIFFFPLKSTGSIFNNYIMAQATFFLGLYFYNIRKKK